MAAPLDQFGVSLEAIHFCHALHSVSNWLLARSGALIRIVARQGPWISTSHGFARRNDTDANPLLDSESSQCPN